METRIRYESDKYLLDVTPSVDGLSLIINDLTWYMNQCMGIDFKKYVDSATHSIQGNNKTILIIDSHEVLDDEKAKRLAIKWYKGETVWYRLD